VSRVSSKSSRSSRSRSKKKAINEVCK